MAVDETDRIDIIGIEPKTNHVVLTVSDHLDWSDTIGHQRVLQDKLNTYLAFLESGEVFESYPEAIGRRVTLRVVFKFAPDKSGSQFLARASEVIETAGFNLRYEVLALSYDN
jgi:hypothetical protein